MERNEEEFISHLSTIDKQTNGRQLSESEFNIYIDLILKTIEKTTSEATIGDACDVLQKVLNYENNNLSQDTIDALLKKLSSKLLSDSLSLSSQLALLKCIKSSLITHGSVCDEVDYNLCLLLINNVNKQQLAKRNERNSAEDLLSEVIWNKIVLNSLRILRYVISHKKIVELQKLLNTVLGFLKVYIFYGLAGYNVNKANIGPLFASPLNQYIPEEVSSSPIHSKHRNQRKRKSRRKNADKSERVEESEESALMAAGDLLGTTTPSDSDQSSSEQFIFNPIHLKPMLRETSTKIRIVSYECLCDIVKGVNKRIMFGYWSSFVPDNSGVGTTEFSVLTTLLKDPVSKVRSKALCFLRELLISGKNFVFSLVNDTRNQSKHPFTTLSQTLASMIAELHRGFQLVLFAETNAEVILQALKCLSTLITITPYNKFDAGLLTTILNKSICLLNCEPQIQNSCLALFISAFSLKPCPNELLYWSSSDGRQHIKTLASFCFEKMSSMESIVLCSESLIFLSTFLDCSFSQQFSYFTEILNLAIKVSSHELAVTNTVVQNLIAKYCHSVAVHLKGLSEEVVKELKNSLVMWWQNIFRSRLLTLFQEDDKQLQRSSESTMLDFMSAIRQDVFEEFPDRFKYHLVSLLFNKVKANSSPAVASSAVRCLGIYLNFPSLTEDLSFIMDIAFVCRDLISTIDDIKGKDNVTLIHQTSWTFANLNDTLKKFYSESEDIKVNFILENGRLSLKLFRVSLPSIAEENVKTNVVRSISSLTQLLLQPQRYSSTNESIERFVEEVTTNLIESLNKSKSFKLQWNVCFAFSSLLSSEVYLLIITNRFTRLELSNKIQSSLMSTASSTRNHKVQAYSVDALCSACKTQFYDEIKLEQIVDTIIQAMIEKYAMVPQAIRSIWMDKLCIGLKRLCFVCELKPEQINALLTFFESIDFEADCCRSLLLFLEEKRDKTY